jgi:hypothetical protein
MDTQRTAPTRYRRVRELNQCLGPLAVNGSGCPSCNQLQTVRSPVGPHLSVKEAIVDSPEADVENQSSAMQRTRLS